MNRTLNFMIRNLKELSRDPLTYVFSIGFPVVMLIIFNVINSFSSGNTPMFELTSLLPAILMFSYTFVMLNMSQLVSKDKQTSFLKRLFSSPMKAHEFILGYALIGLMIGIAQSVISIIIGYLISLVLNVEFMSFTSVLLLIISQLPMLLISIFIGILFGIVFNDKSAPGICSIFISLSGILGGCWMPLETMGGFATFCRVLPFYPSVELGRICTHATNAFGTPYALTTTALLGFIPISVFLIGSISLACILFNKSMTSDI